MLVLKKRRPVACRRPLYRLVQSALFGVVDGFRLILASVLDGVCLVLQGVGLIFERHFGGAGGVVRLIHQIFRLHFERSEEHTSELQSLMRNSYAVFCLKKKKTESSIH